MLTHWGLLDGVTAVDFGALSAKALRAPKHHDTLHAKAAAQPSAYADDMGSAFGAEPDTVCRNRVGGFPN